MYVCIWLMIVAKSADPAWNYGWPYSANHTCVCEEIQGVGEYATREDCLEAYAADQYQWCVYNGKGITADECSSAVSITSGVTNKDCYAQCLDLLIFPEIDTFLTRCKFNFYADFGDEVSVGYESCYSNMVYGWSDYDPSNTMQAGPVTTIFDVSSPTLCQTLCQSTLECVHWTWRAYPNIKDESGDETVGKNLIGPYKFQNPPHTCLLYSKEFIDGVLSTQLPSTLFFVNSLPYCNYAEVTECFADPLGRMEVDVLNPFSCLLCDCLAKCAWQSPVHLSGPSFCLPIYRDECHFERPVWASASSRC